MTLNLDPVYLLNAFLGLVIVIIGWKLVKTQIDVLTEKNRRLEKEIAERKRFYELHTVSEEKYRTVFDNALVAMSIVEEDLTISFSNRECEKVLGFGRDEVVGKKRVTDFLDPRDFEMIMRYRAMRKVDPASVPDMYEVRMIHSSGEVKNVLLNVAIIPGTGKMVASFLDITERKKTEDRIKRSLAEKEVLLKEVHHRVKNNLQIISSLLNLQSGKIADARDFELFRESQNRVKSMALIHEKLYRSEDINRINLKEYVNDVVANIHATYCVNTDRIKLTTEVHEVHISLDQAIPCGLIINELVSNCYKHAFPGDRKGEVRISIRFEDGRYAIQVSDNGVGLPEGFKVDKLSSLGIQLVSSLTAQLKGEMSISSDNGTTFRVTF